MAEADDWQNVDDWTTPGAAPPSGASTSAAASAPDWMRNSAANAAYRFVTGKDSPVLTGVADEIYNAGADALNGINDNLNPWSKAARKKTEDNIQAVKKDGFFGGAGFDTGPAKGLLSAAAFPMAPITGTARYAIGRPLSWITPTVTAEEQDRLRKAGVPDSMIPAKDAEENYQRFWKHGVDTAMAGAGARGGSRPLRTEARAATEAGIADQPRVNSLRDWIESDRAAAAEAPAAEGAAAGDASSVPPPPRGPLGVTLSEGQASGELPLIQREQAALRGQMGDAAQARAQAFRDQQQSQVQAARDAVTRKLDPQGAVVAETPQEAGQLVSEGMQSAAAARKAGVKDAYDTAKELPGEIHADAFKGVGDRIKSELSFRDEPIIIDDKLTPFASRAIQDVDDRVSKLFIQNLADPRGAPNPEEIVGVTLKGVDQMRRRLSTFRNDAYASGNAADGRAARAVLESFDAQVDAAVNGGLFKGDPRAVQAWNDARAAHADYKSTFSAGKNDPAGRVVERILGKGNNPAAIPNDVADFLYGSSGVNPNSLNVNVAKKVRGILGEQSPEWAAVKQGMFERLIDAGPGSTQFGAGKVAQRINKFLRADGKELANELFTAPERQLIQEYANLHRRMEVPQAGANWSNTATFLTPVLNKISNGVATLVGGVVGRAVAPGLHGVGEAAGAATANKITGMFKNAKEARRLREQMPLVAEQMEAWRRAVAKADRKSTPVFQREVAAASANLAGSLQRMGVSLPGTGQGPGIGNASEQQQQ